MHIEFVHKNEYALVLADKDQLIRVLNNLLTNAVQSIPEDRKGELHILLSDDKQSNYSIAISDNGCGISENKIKNIFVPYFTTKTNGTGLGLAMVKQIVESINGSISFVSKENSGTTFTIELPKFESEINSQDNISTDSNQ
jgi:signal transduction histidine kinase